MSLSQSTQRDRPRSFVQCRVALDDLSPEFQEHFASKLGLSDRCGQGNEGRGHHRPLLEFHALMTSGVGLMNR